MRTLRDYAGPPEFVGQIGFFEFFEDWVGAYDKWEQQIEDVLDGGGSQVVVVLRQRGRLRGSRSWVELYYGIVFTVEKRLIRRVQVYGSPDEALEASGLSE